MVTEGVEHDPNRGRGTLWTVLIIAFIIYVLPLLALAVDELLLRTYWINRQFPAGARDVFFDVYPFLRFLK